MQPVYTCCSFVRAASVSHRKQLPTPLIYLNGQFHAPQTMHELLLFCPSAATGNYMKDLEECLGVQGAMAQVNTALLDTEQRCEAFKAQFAKFEFLWKKDMQQALKVRVGLVLRGAELEHGWGRRQCRLQKGIDFCSSCLFEECRLSLQLSCSNCQLIIFSTAPAH